jgi:glycosyltransferase involved in cell wall biosynthesis
VHIVHIITGLGQGGAESMLEKLILAARLEDPSITHEVISLGSMGEIGPRLVLAGVPVRALRLNQPTGALVGLPTLVAWLRAAGPHAVVQTWMYHADLIGGIAAWIAGQRRVIWNIRQTGLELGDISRATRSVVRVCAALSRRLPKKIVCNARAAIPAHAALRYHTEHFEVIPNGFDTSKFTRQSEARPALRKNWRIADDEIVIGMVARFDPQKDHSNFVAAAAMVASEVPAARFVLVGRGIRKNPDLTEHIARIGLSSRFVLEEQRGDMPAVMSALDVFCLSSRAEGFPNVLGEAMACETPAVSTDAGDARMLIGDDALIAQAGDPAALAACILRAARLPPSQRAELGRRQRSRIESEFNITQIWRRYRALYKQL